MKHLKSALCAFFAVIGSHALLLSVFFALLMANLRELAIAAVIVFGCAAVVAWLMLEHSICSFSAAHHAVFPAAVLLSSAAAIALDAAVLTAFGAGAESGTPMLVYTFFLCILFAVMTLTFLAVRLLIFLVSRARGAIYNK